MLVVVLLTLAMPSIASAVTWTGRGDGTSWDDGKNWSSNQVPERDDEVTIGPQPPGNVKLNGHQQVKGLTLHTGGYIDGHNQVGGRSVMSHRLTISKRLTWIGGEINSYVRLKAGSVSTISGGPPHTKSLGQEASMVNEGTLTFAGDVKTVNLWHNSRLVNSERGTLVLEHGAVVNGGSCCVTPARILNRGRLRITRPPLSFELPSATVQNMSLNNSGLVEVESGLFELAAGPHEIADGARFTGTGITGLSGTATLHGAVDLAGGTFQLAKGGELAGTGCFVGGGLLRWTGGVIEGTVTIPPEEQVPRNRLVIAGADEKALTKRLVIQGPSTRGTNGGNARCSNGENARYSGVARFNGGGRLLMSSSALLENGGALTVKGGALVEATACCVSPARIVNRSGGTLISDAGAPGFATLRGPALKNEGAVEVRSGTLEVDFPPYTQAAGRTVLAGGRISSAQPVVLKGGALRGTGRLDAPLTNESGVVAPGDPASADAIGTIGVRGPYVQHRTGKLQIDLKRPTPLMGHDRLEVDGAADLDGVLQLDVHRAPGPTAPAADRLKIVTAGGRVGGFRRIRTGPLAAITADGVHTFTVDNPQYLRVGMSINLVDKTTGKVLASDRKMTAINASTRVVTYGGADVKTKPGTHVPVTEPAALPDALAYFADYKPKDVDLRVMTSFPGLDRTTPGAANPPDTTIAITAGHVIEATNSVVRLMTPKAKKVDERTLKDFFAAPVTNDDLFDPKVILDPSIGPDRRVYLIALQHTDAPRTSRIWLMVSRSPDPASLKSPSDWCRYPIDSKGSNPPAWADWPGIAVGRKMLVVTTNQVTFSSGKIHHAAVRVLEKGPLAKNATGTCPPLSSMRERPASTIPYDKHARSLAPVQPLTPPPQSATSNDLVYLLSAEDTPSSTYRLWLLSDVLSTPTPPFVRVGGYFTFRDPPDSPQPPGGAGGLDTRDAAITQAVGLGDTIWGVQATECNKGGGSPESCVRAVPIKVDAPDASGAWRATLSYEPDVIGEPGLFYTFPGVAVNKDGQTALVYQVSGTKQPLSTWWRMKDADEDRFTPPNRLSVGSCSRARPRFGDYTGAHTDPDNKGFWLAGERATTIAGTCQWETQIGGFTP